MRRLIATAGLSGTLLLLTAGTVLGAHCVNQSKPDGAGQHVVILIDPVTEEDTVVGGKLRGGFVDVYLDLDQSGTLSSADILLVNDTFLVANHSSHPNPAQGTPAVLPPVERGADPGGADHGVGSAD